MAVEFNKTWLQGREERRFTTRGEDKEAGIRSCSEGFSHLAGALLPFTDKLCVSVPLITCSCQLLCRIIQSWKRDMQKQS